MRPDGFGSRRGDGETLRARPSGCCARRSAPALSAQGVRLPSSRALAAQLGVSRGVTSEAYGQLAAQGFLDVPTKSAPVVARVAAPPPPASRPGEPARTPRFDLADDAGCRAVPRDGAGCPRSPR